MSNHGVRWTGEGLHSHYLSDLNKGFIGSSILIAHRPGVSDNILYKNYLLTALNLYQAVVIFPLAEPYYLPDKIKPILVSSDEINHRSYKRGKIYRFQTHSFEEDRNQLDEFYCRHLFSKKRKVPFVIIIDTLKKWHPILEDHIRLLLREAPLSNGSVLVHCPLAIVPPDLLSVFGNVMVVWPSQHEIELLNSHFPADEVPPPENDLEVNHSNRMLVFKSIPFSERGWEWKIFQLG